VPSAPFEILLPSSDQPEPENPGLPWRVSYFIYNTLGPLWAPHSKTSFYSVLCFYSIYSFILTTGLLTQPVLIYIFFSYSFYLYFCFITLGPFRGLFNPLFVLVLSLFSLSLFSLSFSFK
jgi:hypothetical protein